jgi:hypothetical protein
VTAKKSAESQARPAAREGGLALYYRQRSHECQRLAETAGDTKSRAEWIELANQWIYLSLRTRRDEPDALL